MVHPVKNDMGMVIRFEPSFADFETLPVFRFRLTAKPMSLVLVQEDLEGSDAPASPALLAKLANICQCRVRSDEQHALTDWRASSHLGNFPVLAFAFTLLLLHRTACLFLDHPLDVVIVRLQIGITEARVYPLLVTGSQFGHDVDLRLADIAHVLGSSPVMSPT